MEAKSLSVEDPESLRALSHPLRLELLDYLQEAGTATATQCAQRTGESVASCSFHLRQLAKYGFIERAESQGREKPWRAVAKSLHAAPHVDQPGNTEAVVALARVQAQREVARAAANFDELRKRSDLQTWLENSALNTQSAWLTVEELAEVSRILREITDKFSDRKHVENRPESARRVRVFSLAVPDLMSSLNED